MAKENNLDLTNAISIIHSIFSDKKCNDKKQIFVDATCGNGHDTRFLSTLGNVYSFDIQKSALEKAEKMHLNNVIYIHDSHSNIKKHVLENIDGAIFNLGYLPGGDKSIVTKKESTLKALNEILDLLNINGLIGIVLYPGHDNGKEEEIALLKELKQLSQKIYNVVVFDFINRINNSPYPIIIEKIRSQYE